ncbi:MAG: hypothetical protein M3Y87_12155 [Myxococcota bacterium]|nr:hypothetical protein [Myxococcota bacterium]
MADVRVSGGVPRRAAIALALPTAGLAAGLLLAAGCNHAPMRMTSAGGVSSSTGQPITAAPGEAVPASDDDTGSDDTGSGDETSDDGSSALEAGPPADAPTAATDEEPPRRRRARRRGRRRGRRR